MDIQMHFLGAAQSVTGSKFVLEVDSLRVMVDCGMFQGVKALRLRNWEPLPVEPASLDAVVITHAHIDHIGYLPRLVADGFRGPIYMTPPTRDLAELLLRDSAKLQEEEADYANRKGYSKHSPAKPLYTGTDVEAVLPLIRTVPCGKDTRITNLITFRYYQAGHILGAAIVRMTVHAPGGDRVITFSGDLGRYDQPIMPDPEAIAHTDILLVEGTYGNRNNPYRYVLLEMAKVINETFDAGGVVLIPSFAVGRTQELLYHLYQLIQREAIPQVPVYLDSPMAGSATELYRRHHAAHRLNVQQTAEVFDAPWVNYARTPEQSMAINGISKGAIIISASGMCVGGRILHHLYHRLPNPQDTLLFAGFQAHGTRGRDILEGRPTVRIFGQEVAVNCRVAKLNGLSAHADLSELREWMGNFTDRPKHTFLIHTELDVARVMQKVLNEDLDWPNVSIPDYGDRVPLYQGLA